MWRSRETEHFRHRQTKGGKETQIERKRDRDRMIQRHRIKGEMRDGSHQYIYIERERQRQNKKRRN